MLGCSSAPYDDDYDEDESVQSQQLSRQPAAFYAPRSSPAAQRSSSLAYRNRPRETYFELPTPLVHQDLILPHQNIRPKLTIGMSMRDVEQIWGQPDTIFAAGEVNLGHQKWIYSTQKQMVEGHLLPQQNLVEDRVVYFEQGKVIGWEISPYSRYSPYP